MKIWIDADACPRAVKDIVFRAAERLEIQTVVVANQVMRHPDGAEIFSAYTTMVNRGSDGRPVPVEPLFYQAPWKPSDDETRKHQEIVERMRQRRQRG